jgi:hypothetical protein
MRVPNISAKQSNFILLLLLFLCFIPFLIIAFYNYYSADDYFFALNRINNATFFEAQKFCYDLLNGRYTSTFYLSWLPIALRIEGFAWISPVLTLCLTLGSMYYFSSAVLSKQATVYKLSLTFILFVPFMSLLANPAEAIYWASGTSCYGISIFFLFFFLGNIIKLLFREGGNRSFIFSILTLILLIGTNETVTIIINFILVLLLFYDLATRKKFNLKLITIVLIGVACTLFVVKAPGNKLRVETSQKMFDYTVKGNLVHNSQQVVDFISKYTSRWQGNNILLFCDIVLLLLLIKLNISESKYYEHFLWLFIPILYLSLFLGLFPSFYTLGVEPPDRVYGIPLTFYILFNFYIVFLLSHVFSKWLQKIKPEMVKVLFTVSIMAVVFQVSTTTNNIRKSFYYAFFNNEVRLLHQEMQDRITTLKASPDSICKVNNLFNRPTLLYRNDLSFEDSKYFANDMLSGYYKKRAITVNPFKGIILQTNFYDFEGANKEVVLGETDTSVAFSSKNSMVMRAKDCYGVTVKIPLTSINNYQKINGLEISFKTLSSDTSYQFIAYLYVNTLGDESSLFAVQKLAVPIKPYKVGSWETHSFTIPVVKKEIFNANNKIVFFFQNRSEAVVYTDDLKLQFIE